VYKLPVLNALATIHAPNDTCTPPELEEPEDPFGCRGELLECRVDQFLFSH
jgi:hypothetical protein|tara:strand:- start:3481 stop:3633 length:153 start_codon:yes stop_codon:yes gene_type:complete